MIVADSSALILAATDSTSRGAAARARIVDDGPVVAPHLVDAEIGQGIRGLLLRGLLDRVAAAESRLAAEALVDGRFPHRHLGLRAWDLRDNVSFYDGLYVALAEQLKVALVTADRRLAGATGAQCLIAPV